MDFLAPPAACLAKVRHGLECGLECGSSASEAVRAAIGPGGDEFSRQMRRWWLARERGAAISARELFNRPVQRILVETLERGLKGEPIMERLAEIEEEMKLAMIDCVERHLQRLPVLMLLPLTGLVFPSFMLLLLGPLVGELLRSLG
jgi:hypothetical protein